VDVRRPDAKFAAGLITFARAAGAALVRADGTAIEPTAGGFGLALRESAAWRYVQDRRVQADEF
jgi:cysteine synthase